MKIDSKDFRLRPEEKIKLKDWPTRQAVFRAGMDAETLPVSIGRAASSRLQSSGIGKPPTTNHPGERLHRIPGPFKADQARRGLCLDVDGRIRPAGNRTSFGRHWRKAPAGRQQELRT